MHFPVLDLGNVSLSTISFVVACMLSKKPLSSVLVSMVYEVMNLNEMQGIFISSLWIF